MWRITAGRLVRPRVAAAYTLLPVIAIAVESVRGPGFTLDWYRQGLRNPVFWKAFATSLALAVTVGATSVLLGFGSVRLVLRLSRRMRMLAYLTISLPVLLPVLVSGFALHTYFSALGIDGTLLGLFFAQVAYVSPIAFFLLTMAHARLDPETRRML